MSLKKSATGAVVGTALWCLPFTASADAPRTDQELNRVSGEAARHAAEQIACASPRARQYLAGPLRAIQQRRWGMMRESLEGATANIATDALYAAARGDVKGEALAGFMSAPPVPCSETELTVARQALARADVEPHRTSVDACASKGLSAMRVDPACALALASKDALLGTPEETAEALADLIAAVAFERLYKGKSLTEPEIDELFDNTALALRHAVLANDDEHTIEHEIAHAFGTVDVEAIRPEACHDGKLVDELTAGALGSQHAFCTATRPDLDLDKVQIQIATPGGATVTTTLQHADEATELLEHALTSDGGRSTAPGHHDELVAEAVLCSVPLAAPDRALADCSGGRLVPKRSAVFKLSVGSVTWTVTLGDRAQPIAVRAPQGQGLSGLVSGATEIDRLHTSLATLVEERLLGIPPRQEALRDLAGYAVHLTRLAREVDGVYVTRAQRAMLVQTIESLPVILDRSTGPATAGPPATCAEPRSAAERIACQARPGGTMRSLLEAVESRQLRAVAVRTARYVAPADDSTSCSDGTFGRFLTALAVQLPEAPHGGQPEPDALASVQLERAAHDVAQCATSEGQRAVAVSAHLMPAPAVRFSWNSAYLNAWGTDGFRIVPSLDAVAARLELMPDASSVRAALHGSLVDLFAPFSELAMRRPDVVYEDKSTAWLDFVRPRLDASVSFPGLSRHVFLSAGVSLRTVAPLAGSAATGAPRPADRARYTTLLSSKEATSDFARFVETNLALRYAF